MISGMYSGSRVTDAVEFYRHRGELPGAVSVVRRRAPERFRWRNAVSGVTAAASTLVGRERMRVEEPIREIILDLPDLRLRREVVLDARRSGVDLDRGEVLPSRTVGDLRRVSFLVGVDVSVLERYLRVPEDFDAPIDVGACVLLGRALSAAHRKRAQQLWLEVPEADPSRPSLMVHQYIAKRAERNAAYAKRWDALARALVDDQGV